MTNDYVLVLTGEILPGFTPESVWPNLAETFHIAPDKRQQLQARVPQIIKRASDPGKLEVLQARIARIGAQAELYPPDERPPMFVLPTQDDAPCGPVPDALVRQYLARGVWAAESILVAPAGSTTWMPYHELDEVPTPPPVPPRPAPAAGPAMLATQPVRRDTVDDAMLDVLPAGEAIHAGFWRRCAAVVLDGWIIAIPLIILNLVPILGGILGLTGQWLYFALMESSSWQATLGKRVMGIQVADERGHRIGFGRATGRYFGKILSGIILYIGFMMAGWTERRQALHDMMAGTFVVFKDVQPGRPLPEERPPMPWYGWALGLVFPTLMFLGILAAIVLPAYQEYKEYTLRTRVSEAMRSTDTIRAEIARQGCVSGSRVPPNPWIGTVEVRGDDETQSCSITLTLGDTPDVPDFARGKFIELERDDGGDWVCSSSLPKPYLPQNCR